VATNGAFQNFLAGLAWLRKFELPFNLKYPPVGRLIRNAERIEALAESLGSNKPLPHVWEMTLHVWHEPVACDRIKSLRLSPGEAARQKLEEPGVAYRDSQLLLSGNGIKFKTRIFSCRAGKSRLMVNSRGQLQVCLEVRHPDTLYNLKAGTLLDAIKNHLPKIRSWRFNSQEYLERCGKCLLRPACPLCPACSWMEYGNLEQPCQYHCDVMHEEARRMGLIKPGQLGWQITTLNNPK
jgi:radical SAM protein with 4Fe4S-binding SPASM domain